MIIVSPFKMFIVNFSFSKFDFYKVDFDIREAPMLGKRGERVGSRNWIIE